MALKLNYFFNIPKVKSKVFNLNCCNVMVEPIIYDNYILKSRRELKSSFDNFFIFKIYKLLDDRYCIHYINDQLSFNAKFELFIYGFSVTNNALFCRKTINSIDIELPKFENAQEEFDYVMHSFKKCKDNLEFL